MNDAQMKNESGASLLDKIIFNLECPSCKTANQSEAKYCLKCGHLLIDIKIKPEETRAVSNRLTKNKNLRSCRTCGGDVAKGVKRCLHCGQDQRNFFRKHKILTGFLFIMALSILGNAAQSPADKAATKAKDAQELIYIGAYLNSETIVKDHLKSPSTAKFPEYSKGSVYYVGTTLQVISYVDSQNGFGATVRTRYAVNITEFTDHFTYKNFSMVAN